MLSTLTAAQMRKMMEGVVLFGTGKPAQLNGYSSGGKTGTAQKVDPVTHLYSKTMHVASFAGIAPVNNPVIAVAVIMDNPKGGSYYGAAVSAPVFAEVAQQVLEYLNVPHDIDVRPAEDVSQGPKSLFTKMTQILRGATSTSFSRRLTTCPQTIRCASPPPRRRRPLRPIRSPIRIVQTPPPPASIRFRIQSNRSGRSLTSRARTTSGNHQRRQKTYRSHACWSYQCAR